MGCDVATGVAVLGAAVVRTTALAVGCETETTADTVGWALAETVGVGSPLGAALTSKVEADRKVDGGVSSAESVVDVVGELFRAAPKKKKPAPPATPANAAMPMIT